MYNNIPLINYFLKHGADVNMSLYGAALTGNKDLIDEFIARGANDLNRAIISAGELYDLEPIIYDHE